MNGSKEINNIGWWLREKFGTKVVKLSLDGGFTCPNRDGTLSTGGCIFCSPDGSGELASSLAIAESCQQIHIPTSGRRPLGISIEEQIDNLKNKWPKATHFIAYFQSHTNTYASTEYLRKLYEAALAKPDIIGLAIATRPDCIDTDILDLLSELNDRTFLWIELGLQTIHGDNINRCYDLAVYDETVRHLTERNIRIVTHLILGLPQPDGTPETKEMMTESVRYASQPIFHVIPQSLSKTNAHPTQRIFGLKLHLLNVIKGSGIESIYPGYTPFDSLAEYVSFVCDLLEIIPPDITIHRLTGDVPRKLLISPEWSYKKRTILNGIAHEMRRRGSVQGCKL